MTEMFDYTVYEKQKNSFSENNPPRIELYINDKNELIKSKKYKKKLSIYQHDSYLSNLSKVVKVKNEHMIHIKRKLIKFKINLYTRSIQISIYNDKSLEDLYTKIYNAVYPEYSSEKNLDIIPQARETVIPRLYYISVFNDKENIMFLPIHKFITLEIFMKTKPEYFIPHRNFIFCEPVFQIYAFDEYSLSKIEKLKSTNEKQTITYEYYIKKIFSCIGKGQILKK